VASRLTCTAYELLLVFIALVCGLHCSVYVATSVCRLLISTFWLSWTNEEEPVANIGVGAKLAHVLLKMFR